MRMQPVTSATGKNSGSALEHRFGWCQGMPKKPAGPYCCHPKHLYWRKWEGVFTWAGTGGKPAPRIGNEEDWRVEEMEEGDF